MRYKLKLNNQIKTNYIKLPADSPLRQAQTNQSAICQAIKVEILSTHDFLYFGFVGGASQDSQTLEISHTLARVLQLHDDMLVQASLEFSFEKIQSIEIEPITVEDFEVIEQFSSQVEDQLLNQVSVFANKQVFCLLLNNHTVKLRSLIKSDIAKCFFLTVDSELHIQAKTRQKNQNQKNPMVNEEPALDSASFVLKDSKNDLIGVLNCPVFSSGDLVRVTFKARPSILDIDFKEFQAFKLLNKPIPSGEQDIYLFVRNDEKVCTNFNQFEFQMCQQLVKISKLDKPVPTEQNLTIAIRTSNQLMRQALIQKNQQAFDIIKDLLKLQLQQILQDLKLNQIDQLVINHGQVITVDQRLDFQSMLANRIQHLVFTATFKFNHATINAMNKPKFTTINSQGIDQFLSQAQLGFDSTFPKLNQRPNNLEYYQDVIDKINQFQHQGEKYLVYGSQQVGKTQILTQIDCDIIDCQAINSTASHLDSIDLVIEYLQLSYEHNQATQRHFVLDNVHALCPCIDQQSNVLEVVKSTRVTKWLIERESSVGTVTRHYTLINSNLVQTGQFDNIVEVLPPNKQQRYEIIKNFILPIEFGKQEVKMQQMAQQTEYFLVKDFKYLMDQQVTSFQQLSQVVDEYKRNCFPAKIQSEVCWNQDVAGLKQCKNIITEMFGVTQQYSLFFKQKRINQGLLLYGPPGCGKTFLASAIAKEFNINFIAVKGPELLNKYIGASEQNVRELFDKAQQQKPCILFFDEFDSLVPTRGSGQTVVTDRIVNQFLCYLDGVEGRDGVFVLAATSRPDMIDAALLRPGRVDKAAFCGFPDQQERLEILKIYLKKFKIQVSEECLNQIATKTNNFTSADLKGLCQNCQLSKLTSGEPVVEQDLIESLADFTRGLNDQEAVERQIKQECQLTKANIKLNQLKMQKTITANKSIPQLIQQCTLLKQQCRHDDASNLMVDFFTKNKTYISNGVEDQGDLMNLFRIDKQTCKDLFLLCNEFSSKLTVVNKLDQSQILIEAALLVSQQVPRSLLSCLYSNICCFHERAGDLKSAKLYQQHSHKLMEEKQLTLTEKLSNAINISNGSVVELKAGNFASALAASKRALGLIERDILQEINQYKEFNAAFLERVQILLIAYYNYGMCMEKNGQKASETFQHALKISSKFLGANHFFTQKLHRKCVKNEIVFKNSNNKTILKQHEEFLSGQSSKVQFLSREKSIEQISHSSKFLRTLDPNIKLKHQLLATALVQFKKQKMMIQAFEQQANAVLKKKMEDLDMSLKIQALERQRLEEQRIELENEQKKIKVEMLELQEARKKKEHDPVGQSPTNNIISIDDRSFSATQRILSDTVKLQERLELAFVQQKKLSDDQTQVPNDEAKKILAEQVKSIHSENQASPPNPITSNIRMPYGFFQKQNLKSPQQTEQQSVAIESKDRSPAKQPQLDIRNESLQQQVQSSQCILILPNNQTNSCLQLEPILENKIFLDQHKTACKQQDEQVKRQNSKQNLKIQLPQKDEYPDVKIKSHFQNPQFSIQEVEKILEDDANYYDVSVLLVNGIVEQDIRQSKMKIVSKTIYSQGKYIKISCQGYICHSTDRLAIKLTGQCQDADIEILPEQIDNQLLTGICKLIYIQEVLPLTYPLRLIRTFEQFFQICIAPFLYLTNGCPGDLSSDRGSEITLPQNQRQIEIWGRPAGLLESQVQITFLDCICNISIHHLQDQSLRIGITNIESQQTNTIYVELEYHKTAFDKIFLPTPEVQKSQGEIQIPSYQILPIDFIETLKPALKDFEKILKKDFEKSATFGYLSFQRQGLIYQIRVDQDGKIEIWTLKDNIESQQVEIKCKTVYELQLKKHEKLQQIERSSVLLYDNFWMYFGVHVQDISLPIMRMVCFIYLTTLFFYLPTMAINRGSDEDSDNEEQAFISRKSIDTISYVRQVITVANRQVPVTVSLLGCEGKRLIGIKVTLFDPDTIQESGFLLVVDQRQWEKSDEEKTQLKLKQKTTQDPLIQNFTLPAYLKETGGEQILKTMIIQDRNTIGTERSQNLADLSKFNLYWPSPYGVTVIDYFRA